MNYQHKSILLILLVLVTAKAQGYTWTQKANFAGTARYSACGFSIGNKGYIGTGFDGSLLTDFWEYDPASDVWTQKASFNGAPRYGASCFSDSTHGYIGLGRTTFPSGGFATDLWAYDPAVNTWTLKANFPGSGRYTAISFSIGSKGYVGTGYDGTRFYDLWEYDMLNDTWTAKTNFAGTNRQSAAAFAVNGKGYLCTGHDGISKKDTWEYNPVQDSWTQKADFGGQPRYGATAFDLGGFGFVGMGNNGAVLYFDFWQYDPASNNWTSIGNYPGSPAQSNAAVGFSIGNKAYVGTGSDVNTTGGTFTQDFWELNLPVAVPEIEKKNTAVCRVLPSVFTENSRLECLSAKEKVTVIVYDRSGKQLESFVASGNMSVGGDWAAGTYTLKIISHNATDYLQVVKLQ